MKILSSKFIKSGIDQKHWIDDDISEVLLLGRSNVGKSTFINTLCNNRVLAKVSSTPGKTQMLNFFDINDGQFRFVDCPGYGFSRVSKTIQKQFVTMMETYLEKRDNLKLAILLLDLRRVPSKEDLLMFSFLKSSNIPVLIVTTKLDKLRKNDISKQEKIINQTLKQVGNYEILIKSSSINKLGYSEILSAIVEYI